MTIKEIKEMANDQIECNFEEVRMYTLIHIAESLEQLNKKSETGFGLLNTIQRLRLLYGRKASFEIINEDNRVKTTLLIPKETIL